MNNYNFDNYNSYWPSSYRQYSARANFSKNSENLDFTQTNLLPSKANSFSIFQQKYVDNTWLTNWMKQRNSETNISKIKPWQPEIAICELKNMVKRSFDIVQNLEKFHCYLSENIELIEAQEWEEKTNEIQLQKNELDALLLKLQNSNFLENLKKKLHKRKLKRLSLKNKKIERKNNLKCIYESRKKLHQKINHWFKKKQEEIEKVKREECWKRDADCVLSEVTKKKSDARKHLTLLSSLAKLRSVREKTALGRGEKISLEDSLSFTKNIDYLTNMWEKALKTYCTEEQGLKLMLEQNAVDDNYGKISKELEITNDWGNIIFGPKTIPNSAYWDLVCAEKDIETFIAVRKSWDTFLSHPNVKGASRIPIGWILPQNASSDEWTNYFRKDN